MAEIIVNKKDLELIINGYFGLNKNATKIAFEGNDSKKICRYFFNGKECIVHIFIKKDCINLTPVGKNKEDSTHFIDYLKSKGFSKDIPTKQVTIVSNETLASEIIAYLEDNFFGLITCEKNKNIYKVKGYNEDILTITQNQSNIVLQGRPFYVFGIVSTYIAENSNYSFDEYIDISNRFTTINNPTDIIRQRIKDSLKESYTYFDEALLKSISGSFTFISAKVYSEDYSGALTGVFKGLEGYLKKLLINKFHYTLQRNQAFNMFYVQNGSCEIDQNSDILNSDKIWLKKLYSLYQNKRNVYSHASGNPLATAIIENYKDAESIRDEILENIRESYRAILNI